MAVDIDTARFRWEARRAIDGAGVTMVELLDPGTLHAAPGEDEVRLLADGIEVGAIPLARLAALDPERIATAARSHAPALCSSAGLDPAAFVAAIDAGRFVWLDQAEGEAVFVYVMVNESDAPLAAVFHRSMLVDGWPAPDPAP